MADGILEEQVGHESGNLIRLGIAVIALASMRPVLVLAQMEEGNCGDECKINSNLAVVINVPLNPTSQVASPGWGGVAGLGYNFNKYNAVIAEGMWNRVYPAGDTLQPLRTALAASDLHAATDIFTLTGNYRFEARGDFFGGYVIGGGGLYVRYSHLSRTVSIVTAGTPCTQAWLWWGFNCTAGFVTASQTLANDTSSVLGGNAGGGMTFRVYEAPYRIYVEARYHYAPTKHINTQFVTVTFGLRY